jgi:hypothetical protein
MTKIDLPIGTFRCQMSFLAGAELPIQQKHMLAFSSDSNNRDGGRSRFTGGTKAPAGLIDASCSLPVARHYSQYIQHTTC